MPVMWTCLLPIWILVMSIMRYVYVFAFHLYTWNSRHANIDNIVYSIFLKRLIFCSVLLRHITVAKPNTVLADRNLSLTSNYGTFYFCRKPNPGMEEWTTSSRTKNWWNVCLLVIRPLVKHDWFVHVPAINMCHCRNCYPHMYPLCGPSINIAYTRM